MLKGIFEYCLSIMKKTMMAGASRVLFLTCISGSSFKITIGTFWLEIR